MTEGRMKVSLEVWDKTFARITETFPMWKPTLTTSAIWYDELGFYPPKVVWAAVKALSSVRVSDFPPNVFQIIAEIRRLSDNDGSVDQIWENLRKESASGNPDLTKFSARTLKSLAAIGGLSRIGSCNVEKDMPWLKKDFLRVYEDFTESEMRDDVKSQHEIESPKLKALIQGVVKGVGDGNAKALNRGDAPQLERDHRLKP